jgi:hypothetical protein
MTLHLRVAFVLAATALSACNCSGPATCTSDQQCDPRGEGFRRCDLDIGFCVCNDDRGCGGNETCNAVGRCQALVGCDSNDDCSAGSFCDVVTGQCFASTECNPTDGQLCCVLDSQCGYGNVCDPVTFRCQPGCREAGDCRLDEACVRGLGQPLGQCAVGVCGTDNQCAFGQLCNANNECVTDTRGNYCDGCAGGVASDDCGSRGNFCLTDTVNGGEFCGVTCNTGEECPFGFGCQTVIIIPPAAPFCVAEVCVIPSGAVSGTCSTNQNITCDRDEDCPIGFPGGTCPRADVGNCKLAQLTNCSRTADCPDGDECIKQECRFGENDVQGYCSCTRDADCPRDTCKDIIGDEGGNCELSGIRCFDDDDCEALIECQNGGCYIGKNCAPSNDRTCADLRPVQ